MRGQHANGGARLSIGYLIEVPLVTLTSAFSSSTRAKSASTSSTSASPELSGASAISAAYHQRLLLQSDRAPFSAPFLCTPLTVFSSVSLRPAAALRPPRPRFAAAAALRCASIFLRASDGMPRQCFFSTRFILFVHSAELVLLQHRDNVFSRRRRP